MSEVLLICLVCPASLALRLSLAQLFLAPTLALDVITLALPPLAARPPRERRRRGAHALAQAILAPERAALLCCASLALAAAVSRAAPTLPAAPPPRGALPLFVAAYRCSVLLGTCAAILAVDFRLFPLRLAKTHATGTSLMDLGAGSFAFAHGACAHVRAARADAPQAW